MYLSEKFSPLKIIILGAVFGASFALLFPLYMNWVVELGYRIPQDNMLNDYWVAIVWAGLLGTSIMYWPIPDEDKQHLLLGWLIKCFVCLFLLLFFESHYPQDAEGYFAEPLNYKLLVDGTLFIGEAEYHKGPTIPQLRNGTFNTFLFIWYYNKFVPEFIANSYHSLKLTFSMIGLVAIYIFHRASIIFSKKHGWQFFYFLLLFPTILIWSSIIGKESLILLGISFFVYGITAWHQKKSFKYGLVMILGIILASYVRVWIGCFLTLSLFFYFVISRSNAYFKITLMIVTAFFLLNTSSVLLNQFRVKNLNDAIKIIERITNNMAKGGSAMETNAKFSDLPDLIKFVPPAVFKALFRPLPGDVSGAKGILASLEGLLLLFLFFRACIRLRLNDLNHPLLIAGIMYIACWAFLYGFAIGNFGTGLRYKVQILPVFLALLLYFGRPPMKDSKTSDVSPSSVLLPNT